MRNIKYMLKFGLLGLILIILAGCGDNNNGNPTTQVNQDRATQEQSNTSGDNGSINAWLQQINNGERETLSRDDEFAWGLGYLVYYGSVETTVLDTLIYNALEVHRRLDTGEVAQNDLSLNQQNLLAITDGIAYSPDVDLTEQVGQTPDVRETILAKFSQNQQNLSPDEALDSNEIVGIIAPPVPEAIGGKYLVFTQETPDDEFVFQGVVMATDASTEASTETYSFLGWENLPLLGDAAGPFWNNLPAGVSGDRSNTNEGRPGVLLISEETYREIAQSNFQ